MSSRSFRLYGYGASVRVDVPEDLETSAIIRHIAAGVSVEEGAEDTPDLILTRWSGVFHMGYGERRYGPYHNEDNAFRGVSNGVHFLLGKRSPMTFLHAGAIEIDGKAVIFPGRSRWGKSTLVASLVGQGCGYLSDEYAVVSSNGSILPLAKPIRLRKEGGGADFFAPPGVNAPEGLPCAAMVLTRYEQGVAWDPERLTAGSAVLGALPMALQSRDAPEEVMRALTALAGNAACYRGTRGDGQPTIQALRELQVKVPSPAVEGSERQALSAGRPL